MPNQTPHITYYNPRFYSELHYIAPNLSILIKKVITCGGVVVWYILAIIEPPQSRLFNSGQNWVVAI